MIVVDCFVDRVGVDISSAVPIYRFGDMLDEVGQPTLVVGGHEGACRPSICVGAHANHVTVEAWLEFMLLGRRPVLVSRVRLGLPAGEPQILRFFVPAWVPVAACDERMEHS